MIVYLHENLGPLVQNYNSCLKGETRVVKTHRFSDGEIGIDLVLEEIDHHQVMLATEFKELVLIGVIEIIE